MFNVRFIKLYYLYISPSGVCNISVIIRMSVDVLPPKLIQGPVFQYPAHIHQMKETRSTQVEISQPRRSSIPDNANMKLHINHFDPNYIIYDSSSDTTYLRGRLLGKVRFQENLLNIENMLQVYC